MSKKDRKILIKGVTETGETFRPSDWAQRMSGQLSTFRKHRIRYSPMLQPTMTEGYQCVILDPTLKETNPQLYDSILEFAKANHLKICNENGSSNSHEPS